MADSPRAPRSPRTKAAGAAKAARQAPRAAARAPATTPDSGDVPIWLRRAIALFFTWVVGLLIAYWALGRLKPLLFMIVVALFLSLALEPPVERLTRRGWRRGAATGVVGGLLLLATLGFLFAFGSVAVTQASQLIDNAPRYVREIVSFLNDDFGLSIDATSLLRELQSENGAVQQFGRDLANSAPDIGLAVAEGFLQVVITFTLAFYLTADGPRLRRVLCSRLPPQRQEVVLDTWELAMEKTGSYLYFRGLQAIVCIFATWAFLFLLDVPSALALAIWVGIVAQFIPTIGTYIAMVLPALVTLVNSPVDTIWVLLFLVGYQQFENYLLGPRIARFTLKIHPALTITAVFAGALLFGAVGALLALPATAVIQAMISTYAAEHEVIKTELTKEPIPRDRRRRFPQIRRQPSRGRSS